VAFFCFVSPGIHSSQKKKKKKKAHSTGQSEWMQAFQLKIFPELVPRPTIGIPQEKI
jgi:hypothetical protein